jgi:hypothetical protein
MSCSVTSYFEPYDPLLPSVEHVSVSSEEASAVQWTLLLSVYSSLSV